MSKAAKQSVDTPQLKDVKSSIIVHSDAVSDHIVEQDDHDDAVVATSTAGQFQHIHPVATDAGFRRSQEVVDASVGVRSSSRNRSTSINNGNNANTPCASIHSSNDGNVAGIPNVGIKSSLGAINDVVSSKSLNYQERTEILLSQMVHMLSQLLNERDGMKSGTTRTPIPDDTWKQDIKSSPIDMDNYDVSHKPIRPKFDGNFSSRSNVLESILSIRSEISEEPLDSIIQLKEVCPMVQRKDYDISKISELPYVKAQRPDIEKAFLNYYTELSTMEHRSLSQSDELSFFDVGKFPKSDNVNSITSLLQWLKRMIHYKNAHCIPDYFIRDELETAAARLSDSKVDAIVSTAVADAKLDESEPIKYARLISYLEIRKPKIDYSDFQLLIDQAFKNSRDVMVLMVVLGNIIDSYLKRQELKDIPKLSWIRIIKKLYRKVPDTMETIEFQIPDEVRIRFRGDNGEFYAKTVDGAKIRRELTFIRQRQVKEVSKASFISKDLSMTWNVIMTTYDKIVDGIPLETIGKESKTKKGKDENIGENSKCKACGKSNHNMQNCFALNKLIKAEKIEEKDGIYINKSTGNEITVDEGEFIVLKYNSEKARPIQN